MESDGSESGSARPLASSVGRRPGRGQAQVWADVDDDLFEPNYVDDDDEGDQVAQRRRGRLRAAPYP
eukprot:7288601-Lingulodinium_polyedra.AAC.1